MVGFAAKRTSDSSGRKGLDTLEKAIAEATRRLPGVAFVIIGPGWGELVERQRAAGIRCVHIPFVRDLAGVAAVQRALDVYWVTSRIEGGPVPLLEAMASGVCCVSTPVGMVRDVVRDGENGLMAPFDDVEAFVRQTGRLASDPDLRRRIGESARRTMVDGYQWWQVCRSAHDLYRTAIERFGERPGSPRAPVHAPAGPVAPTRRPGAVPDGRVAAEDPVLGGRPRAPALRVGPGGDGRAAGGPPGHGSGRSPPGRSISRSVREALRGCLAGCPPVAGRGRPAGIGRPAARILLSPRGDDK